MLEGEPVRRRPRSGSPRLSVVVPVQRGDERLRSALEALVASDLPREEWELIVVDDASNDGSAAIAAGYADLVIRFEGRPRGPAYARNRGFEAARGELMAFVDADVRVRPDALRQMIAAIDVDRSIGAVVGVYDVARESRGFVSDYCNLLRHVEQQASAGDTDVLCAGLALIRRDVFVQAGTFDEWRFPRPQAESLELGDRIRMLGYRIRRHREVVGTHLKQWTFGHWVRVDLLDRRVALARTTQFPHLRARAERIQLATRLDTVLAWSIGVGAAVAAWLGSVPAASLAVASAVVLIGRNGRFFATLWRARGPIVAAAAVLLHVVACALYGVAATLGRILFHTVGERQPDPVTQAFAEVGLRTWPPMPTPPSVPPVGVAAGRNGAAARRGAPELT